MVSKEVETTILENQALIHYLLQKKGVSVLSPDYDDLVSIGNIGLIKACNTFVKEREIKFSTYAAKCIENEFGQYYRKNNKHLKNTSLSNIIGTDKNGKGLTLEDIIEDTKSDFSENVIVNDEFIYTINIILNFLEGKYRLVMLYWAAGIRQKGIEGILNIKQSNISRIERDAKLKIKEFVNLKLRYEKVFTFYKVDDSYRISFSIRNHEGYKEIEDFLKGLVCDKGFIVTCNKGQVIIQIPAWLEALSFVADIIKGMEELNIIRFLYEEESISNDTKIGNKCEVQKNEAIDTKVKDANTEKNLKEAKKPRGTQAKKVVQETKKVTKLTKKSKTEKIIYYMLNKEYFTTLDLVEYFPEFSMTAINYAIKKAKTNGDIVYLGIGEYIVKKK